MGLNNPAPAGLQNVLLFPMLSEEAPATFTLGGNYKKQAHGIRHLEAVKIWKIGILVQSYTLNPGTMYCEIWDDTPGEPGAVIANGSASIAQGSISSNRYNWFTFTTPPVLLANTTYWVLIRAPAADASNYYTTRHWDGVPAAGHSVWGEGTTTKAFWTDWTLANYTPFFDIIRGSKP